MEWLASLFTVIGGVYGTWRFIKHRIHKESTSDQKQQTKDDFPCDVYALVGRFVEIYKAHGIERTQIPRFLGEDGGVVLADVSTDERLLHALSEKVLKCTCSKFGISREWLDGKDVPIYPRIWYDKNMKGFIDFLEGLKAEFDEVEFFAIKCEKDSLQKNKERFPIAFVCRGKLDHWGSLGEESIWRHYPLNDTLYWGYDRTRFQMKAMALVAWQFEIPMFGSELPQTDVEKIIQGEVFPGPYLENLFRGAWHLDDYIFANGESVCAKDVADAQKLYEVMKRLGWMDYLVKKTGSVPRSIFERSEVGVQSI
ncbi:hypothetical protein [Trichloromonas sp.]|uniref:hypothetical protein n=1 Tax=Trichloromonas sp. TaxID=3069249 RepID=UPI003D81700C